MATGFYIFDEPLREHFSKQGISRGERLTREQVAERLEAIQQQQQRQQHSSASQDGDRSNSE